MNYDDIIKEWGISKNLGEHPEAEARIYNDFSNYGWIVHIHPSNTLQPYFKVYKNCSFPGKNSGWSAEYCSRISMTEPKYIHCDDCSLKEWVLDSDEKDHLCEIIKESWSFLLSSYVDELKWYTGKEYSEIYKLPIPDYSKLPDKEG